MMPELTLVESVRLALEEELDRNDKLIVLGEDVGPNGGVFRATQGLLEKYGPQRVLDTPLSENGIIGFAIGMALMGLKPVAEIQFVDRKQPSFDIEVEECLPALWLFVRRTGVVLEVLIITANHQKRILLIHLD